MEVMGELVRSKVQIVDLALKEYAAANVPENDRQRFVQVATNEVGKLHEGNIARYRVRPSEFAAWNEARKKA